MCVEGPSVGAYNILLCILLWKFSLLHVDPWLLGVSQGVLFVTLCHWGPVRVRGWATDWLDHTLSPCSSWLTSGRWTGKHIIICHHYFYKVYTYIVHVHYHSFVVTRQNISAWFYTTCMYMYMYMCTHVYFDTVMFTFCPLSTSFSHIKQSRYSWWTCPLQNNCEYCTSCV